MSSYLAKQVLIRQSLAEMIFTLNAGKKPVKRDSEPFLLPSERNSHGLEGANLETKCPQVVDESLIWGAKMLAESEAFLGGGEKC